jgi:hypothetical protein
MEPAALGILGWLVSVTIQRRPTMVEVGDRILVESEKVGTLTRSGVVTAVEDRLITVRWDSGSESGLRAKRRVPPGHRPRSARQAGRQLLSLSAPPQIARPPPGE